MQLARLLSLGFGAVLVVSCGAQSDPTASATDPAPVFSEHRFAPEKAAIGPGNIGADCATQGSAGCRSGICLHAAAHPSQGYVCSARCLDDAQCPTGWRCVSTHPSPDSSICAPTSPQ
jgi:hypothetical protein